MNVKFYLTACLISVTGLGATSCIDTDYVVDNLSTDIGLAPDGLTLPVATLERKTLGEMINAAEEGKNGISLDENGGYLFRLTGKVDPKSVEPFDIPSIDVSIPALSPVTIEAGGGTDLAEVEVHQGVVVETGMPSLDIDQNIAPEGINLPRTGVVPPQIPVGVNIPAGQTYSGNISTSGQSTITIDTTIPKEIKKIDNVWFGPTTSGSEVHMSLFLNSLTRVAASVTIDRLTVTMPARYTLADIVSPSSGAYITGDNGGAANMLVVENWTISSVDDPIEVVFHMQQASLADVTPTPLPDGQKAYDLVENFEYEIDYTLTTKNVTLAPGDLDEAPSSLIVCDPEFRDATFETDLIEIEDMTERHSLDFEVGPFPSTVRKVNYVPFVDGQNILTITADDLGLPFVDPDNDPRIEVTFPSIFVLATGQTGLSGNTLRVPASAFYGAGYTLEIEAVRFGTGEGIPDAEGNIDLSGYELLIDMKDNSFVSETFDYLDDIAGLVVPEEIEVSVDGELAIDQSGTQFEIAAVSEPISISESIAEQFELPEDIEILEISRVDVRTLADQPVELVLAIDVEDPLLNSFDADELHIVVPDFVILTPGQYGVVGNEFYVSKKTLDLSTPGRKELARLGIDGFRNIDINGTTASLQGDLECSLIARSPAGATVTPGPTMTITPVVDIPELKVTRLSGSFRLPIEDYIGGGIDPIDIAKVVGDDFYEMVDPDHELDIAAPIIRLHVKNPTDIAMGGKIIITPKDANDQPLGPDHTLEVDLTIGGGEQKFYIVENGNALAPDGYVGIDAETGRLLKTIPHKIDIEVVNSVEPAVGSFEPSDEAMTFEMEYFVEAPLEFGVDTDLVISYDEEGLGGTFEDITRYISSVKELSLTIDLHTSFPLRLGDAAAESSLVVEFTDKDGAPIQGLETKITGALEGPSTGGGSNRSQLNVVFKLRDDDVAPLGKIEKAHLEIPVGTKDLGRSLNAGDFIEGKITATVKGAGVSLGK